MEDQQFNNYFVVYIEKNVVDNINNEAIIQQFQNMKNSQEILKLYVFELFFFFFFMLIY